MGGRLFKAESGKPARLGGLAGPFAVLLAVSAASNSAWAQGGGAGTTAEWVLISTFDCFVDGCQYEDAVLRYDPVNGAFLGVHVPSIADPTGMAVNPATGTLLVASRSESKVKEYNARTGAFLRDFIVPRDEGLSAPQAILFRANGNLLVTSTQTAEAQNGFNGILEYNGTTGAFIAPFVDGGFLGQNCGDDDCLFGPTAMALGTNGSLYVASSSNDLVIEYNATTGAYIDSFSSSQLDFPTGLAIRPVGAPRAGNILVTSRYRNPAIPGDRDKILEFDKTTRALINPGGTFATNLVKPGMLMWLNSTTLMVADRTQTESAPLFADRMVKLHRDTGAFLGTFTAANDNRLHTATGMLKIAVTIGVADDDYDGDNDVDLKDFGAFQRCFGPAPGAGCLSAFDEDQDNSVGTGDYPQFQLQFTGPLD